MLKNKTAKAASEKFLLISMKFVQVRVINRLCEWWQAAVGAVWGVQYKYGKLQRLTSVQLLVNGDW